MSEPLFLEQGQALRDLKALELIAESPRISQRDLASRLGIALGLTNACLSKMARAGLIKMSRVNGRSLAYHLTPAGFAAKARLSMEYARTTVGMYRAAREVVSEGLSVLASQGVSRVALLGLSDTAEIVGIVCAHLSISIACVIDPLTDEPERTFLGLPVEPPSELERYDYEVLIVTYLDDQDYWMEYAEGLVKEGTPVMRAV